MTRGAGARDDGEPMTHGRSPVAGRPLVGRKKELGVLTRALDTLREGEPKIVEIVGDPGIGKTSLLAEFARGAGIRGHVVLSCRPGMRERAKPFGIVLGAVDGHLRCTKASTQRWIGSDFSDLLARLLPRSIASAGRSLTETQWLSLFRTVRSFLEELAEPDGLVVIFDDLHLVDPMSEQLVAELLRRPPRGPVLLTLAYRPRQMPTLLRTALATAAIERRVSSLGLAPLGEEEVDELLGPTWSRTHRRMLYQASGGVPFYLEGLATDHADPGRDPSGGAFREGFGTLPRGTYATVHGELAELSPEHLLVAQAAAVAGDSFSVTLVAELADLPPAEVREAIGSLLRHDLIRRVGGSARYSYRHQLIRQVVYETTSLEWRLAAHAKAADALLDGDAPVATRAGHLALVARTGDERAISTLVEAASRTVARAPAEAVRWLRSALRLLPDTGEVGSRRLDLMIALAKALAAGGWLDESGDMLQEVVRRLSRDRTGRRTQAVALWAMTERLLGRHLKVRAFLLRELEELHGKRAAEAVVLKLELAATTLLGDAGGIGRSQLKELVTAAEEQPDPVLRVAALGLAVLSDCAAGPMDETDAVLSRAARLADELTDDQLSRRIDGIVWVGWGEIYHDRYTRAMRHIGRGLELARMSGHGSGLPRLAVAMARLLTIQGRLSEAVQFVDEALEVAEHSGSDELLTMALTAQCHTANARGDLETALRAGIRATETGGWVKGRWWRVAWVALAEARLLAGDPEGCIEAVEVVGGGPELPALYAVSRSEVFELLTRAELAAGRPERAKARAYGAELAAEGGMSSARAFALLAMAQSLSGFAPAVAVEKAGEAAAIFARLGRKTEAGRARLVAGMAHTASGHPAQAGAELGQAETLFEQSGARLLLERVRQGQRRIIERTIGRPRRGSGLDLLTKRESQVAVLVSEGHTNRQIAQRLGVSDKTVEAHLARVFGKLGVDSRASVAVLVARSGQPVELPA
ncbi:ATP-binding protein [Rhizohabitans arisaemae]|uniref:ATP-binding protein n=1 Tax=Rhizohabitans arisaemae TaxID=2720610 RepID=UPI0024B26B8B|nr:LuxR family transcriptional regulator [Rhizohabitans arisaemae]